MANFVFSRPLKILPHFSGLKKVHTVEQPMAKWKAPIYQDLVSIFSTLLGADLNFSRKYKEACQARA